ncbi:MAG: hypothetical protein WBV82_01945 [Myxococcaceae bacterium]
MKNFAVTLVFLLSLTGVVHTLEASAASTVVSADDTADSADFANKKKKKKKKGGEESEEEYRIASADALRLG